ncbi:MAG: hypothetical protein IT475_13095 [Aquimonas sp.]|nr:hypothetical protein [Aquimonas sp.]
MEDQKTGFTPDELTLGYTEWKQLENERRKHLAPNVRQWLGQWNLWDLACSPMDDNERRQIRYGHYLGWWHREEVTPNDQVKRPSRLAGEGRD